MSVNRHLKTVARTLLHQAGGLGAVRYWNRHRFRILMYHDFPSVPGLREALAAQCAHMVRHYPIVSLEAITRHLRYGSPLPPNALAVTVDDGNRDFFINGFPVFHAHKIPVTVYLVSGFLDKTLWLWWDKIIYAIENSRRSSFQMALPPVRTPVNFSLQTQAQRQHAIAVMTEALKTVSSEERAYLLNGNLSKSLGVDVPSDPPLHMAPMSWDEVRTLAAHGMDLGAHTVTHPVLSRIQDRKELVHEIAYSKRRIEEEVGRPVQHFCYPYGHWDDFNEETQSVLTQFHFGTAVTAQHGMNTEHTHPFQLRRLGVDAMLPAYYFRERLAGLHSG